MTPHRALRPALGLAAGALLILTASGCAATEPTLDERIPDLDTAIELYRAVDGSECDDPGEPREDEKTIMVLCEDGAVISWTDKSTEDEFQRELLSAMLWDDSGIDAVVGVNVVIMHVDREAVAAQIGGVAA